MHRVSVVGKRTLNHQHPCTKQYLRKSLQAKDVRGENMLEYLKNGRFAFNNIISAKFSLLHIRLVILLCKYLL